MSESLRKVREWSMEMLEGTYGKEEAQAMTKLLLEHATGLHGTQLLLQPESKLSPEAWLRLQSQVKRLLNQEPIQYILEEAWFFGNPFYVNKEVLIPRRETEELAEMALRSGAQGKLLDIGTGSGCIAITLAQKGNFSDIYALDISDTALQVAEKNARNILGPSQSIHFLRSDILDMSQWDKLPKVDLIISNPPYIHEKEEQAMPENVKHHEPHLALFAPGDALKFYKAIAHLGEHILLPEGYIFLEINEAYGKETAALFSGYSDVQIRKDQQGKERFVCCRK